MVKSLKSQLAGVIIFILALVTQLNHAQNVSWLISKREWLDRVSSWGVAIALETTVLYAVINGQKPFSYVFALISILINVAYYESSMDKGHSMFFASDFPSNWPRWIFSVIVPVAIAFYSHVIVKFVEEEKSAKRHPAWFTRWVEWGNMFTDNFVRGYKNSRRGQEERVENLFGLHQSSTDDNESVVNGVGEAQGTESIPDKYRAVVDYLRSTATANCASIVKHTGIAPATLRRQEDGQDRGYLVEMVDLGLLQAVQEGKRVVYSLNGVHV